MLPKLEELVKTLTAVLIEMSFDYPMKILNLRMILLENLRHRVQMMRPKMLMTPRRQTLNLWMKLDFMPETRLICLAMPKFPTPLKFWLLREALKSTPKSELMKLLGMSPT